MRLFSRSSLLFMAGLSSGLVIGLGLAKWREVERAKRSVATAQVFEDVMSAIRTTFVDSLTDEELYVKAAKGVVSTLGDPYSAFLGPAEFRNYRNLLRGRGKTLGLTLEAGLTGLRVAAVVPKTAADRAGLKPGDFVDAIDGQPSERWPADRAMTALERDSVAIRVQSPADSVAFEVHLVHEAAQIPAVGSAVRLSDSVGYLALRSVTSNSSTEVRDALIALRAWQLRGLIVDLRGNRGGPIDEALRIADLFLAPGQKIASVAKRQTRWGYNAAGPDAYPDLTLTLLVDRRTASSAEIIAAALRDNDRAVLVGERTFGKGLIQTTVQLGDSVAVRLTTGRWQGPGGRLISGGIQPDFEVRPTDWEVSLRRSLGPRTGVVRTVLAELARVERGAGRPADSVMLDAPKREVIRTELRRSGLALSRRSLAVHTGLFEPELRRLVAAADSPGAAVRFGLLADPVVAAGVLALKP
ncbi:MAG: S41 family peptidase [Rhodanobacter sp.]